MGRNKKHLCPCGSGKHLKSCCGKPSSSGKLELERMARQLSKTGMHKEACEALEKRLALSPDNPLIWNDLGAEYAAAGQSDKALLALKRAHAVCPTHPVPLYNLGKYTLESCLQVQRSQHSDRAHVRELASEAIGYLTACLEREPDDAACHRQLAVAYRVVKDRKKAMAHMLEVTRLDQAMKSPLKRWMEKIVRYLAQY